MLIQLKSQTFSCWITIADIARNDKFDLFVESTWLILKFFQKLKNIPEKPK